MTTRHLFIGLDGADLGLVRAMGAARLPNLHRLAASGAVAALESVMPPATLPNWTTILTGVGPGVHGVFDFVDRRGASVTFTGGRTRKAPLLVERLDAAGLTCASIGFPGTYPPPKLARGVFVSGWDSPVAFRADASFVEPRHLHGDLVRRFGPMVFDDVDEFHATRAGFHDELPGALARRIVRKTLVARTLLESRRWDLFAIYFGESDTAAHHLFAHHDPTSPRRPEGLTQRSPTPLEEVYEALDHAVGVLIADASSDGSGDDVEVTIASDHGSGASSDEVLYLNRVLEAAGLLTFRERPWKAAAARAGKRAALSWLPPVVRERAFAAFGAALPNAVESAARFGAIDFAETRAFSDELGYFPSVSLNLAGREPGGVVAPSEREAVLRRVEATLRALRSPYGTKRPFFSRVLRREEVYDGPELHRAPDLLLELALDERGHLPCLLPSGTAPRGTGPFRRLAESEYLGPKGRSLPGSHRPRGLFLAAGPSIAPGVEIDAHVADVPATMLARMGLAVPTELEGRVHFELLRSEVERDHASPLRDGEAAGRTLPAVSPPRIPVTRSASDAIVEARLRALGYVD